jgi:hypothetical protein
MDTFKIDKDVVDAIEDLMWDMMNAGFGDTWRDCGEGTCGRAQSENYYLVNDWLCKVTGRQAVLDAPAGRRPWDTDNTNK